MRISRDFADIWNNDNMPRCMWHEENLLGRDLWPSNSDDNHRSPCLGYHDPDAQHNCAMCKPGLARVLVEFDAIDKDGNPAKNQYVICGSVRTRDRDSTGAYSYLDPDTVTTD